MINQGKRRPTLDPAFFGFRVLDEVRERILVVKAQFRGHTIGDWFPLKLLDRLWEVVVE
ncbi:MAG: hypothetical protein HY232_03105 [Acidobacteria bacterium]|nr:hypothetical protein [Acidobacteriota bacterium]